MDLYELNVVKYEIKGNLTYNLCKYFCLHNMTSRVDIDPIYITFSIYYNI